MNKKAALKIQLDRIEAAVQVNHQCLLQVLRQLARQNEPVPDLVATHDRWYKKGISARELEIAEGRPEPECAHDWEYSGTGKMCRKCKEIQVHIKHTCQPTITLDMDSTKAIGETMQGQAAITPAGQGIADTAAAVTMAGETKDRLANTHSTSIEIGKGCAHQWIDATQCCGLCGRHKGIYPRIL
jgi:hypothetical protein